MKAYKDTVLNIYNSNDESKKSEKKAEVEPEKKEEKTE